MADLKSTGCKKKYFAQNDDVLTAGHRAACFDMIEQTRAFLRCNLGGTLKQRGTGRFGDREAGVWTTVRREEIEHVAPSLSVEG